MKKVDPSDLEYARINHAFRLTALAVVFIIGFGSIFYHIVEKFSWLNSVYFCVVTLATVGYGDIVPKTDAGKIFTIFYILTGVGIIATFGNLMIRRAALKRNLRR